MDPAPDLATKPTLRGERVLLRSFRAEDAPRMAEILSDPELRRLTGSVGSSAEAQQPQPLDDGLRGWYATRADQTDRLDLAVEDVVSGLLVGEVVLNQLDVGARTCNLRALVGPDGRDRGLGTEALGLLLGYAFGSLGLTRLTLEVFDFNPRARHVYERLGFVVAGTRVQGLLFDGVQVAAVDMELTAEAFSSRAR